LKSENFKNQNEMMMRSNKENRSNIKWWNQKDFWNEFDTVYKSKGIYLDAVAQFEASIEEIERIAELPSIIHPSEEEDFAGPVERWYCSIANHLFVVTVYIASPSIVRVAFEKDAIAEVLIVNKFKDMGFDVWYES
jgi:hypothetical protein